MTDFKVFPVVSGHTTSILTTLFTRIKHSFNSTKVYLKAVAERLKKIQCSARTNNFKNSKTNAIQKYTANSQCSQTVPSEQQLASDNHYSHQYTSIYGAVSDILFILLLIFSQGIVNKRSIFISLS